MNVYDFDKTIFYPDCSFLFIRWCLRRHPKLLLPYLPRILFYAVLYAMGNVGKDLVEERLFSFIPAIDDLEEEIERFWDANQHRISAWYLAQKQESDLIISASPEFLLSPIARRLGVSMLGTQIDMKTAKIVGVSCYGRQKVQRALRDKIFPDHCIDRFYSDSLSDTPMALCAEEAYLVTKRGQKPIPWPKLTKRTRRRIMKKLRNDFFKQEDAPSPK